MPRYLITPTSHLLQRLVRVMLWTTLCIPTLVTGSVSSVLAQDGVKTHDNAPTADQARQAQALAQLKKGIADFENADYGEAIVAFRESYDSWPTAIAQFNLAKAYLRQAESLHDLDLLQKAERALNTAVSDDTVHKLDDTRLARVTEMRDTITRLEAELGCHAQIKSYEAQLGLYRQQRQTCEEQSDTRRLGHMGVVGAAVGGVGVGSLLVSGILAIRGRGQYNALQPPHTEGRDQYDADVQAFESNQRMGRGTLYVGSALTVLGTGLVIADIFRAETTYTNATCEEVMQREAPTPPVCADTLSSWYQPERPALRMPSSTQTPNFSVQIGRGHMTGTVRF